MSQIIVIWFTDLLEFFWEGIKMIWRICYEEKPVVSVYIDFAKVFEKEIYET